MHIGIEELMILLVTIALMLPTIVGIYIVVLLIKWLRLNIKKLENENQQ